MSAERFRFAVVVLLTVAVAALVALAVPAIAEFLRYQDFMAWCLSGAPEESWVGPDCVLWWRHGK